MTALPWAGAGCTIPHAVRGVKGVRVVASLNQASIAICEHETARQLATENRSPSGKRALLPTLFQAFLQPFPKQLFGVRHLVLLYSMIARFAGQRLPVAVLLALTLHNGQSIGAEADFSWIKAVADATVKEGTEGLRLGFV
jgi:hypothetical protein